MPYADMRKRHAGATVPVARACAAMRTKPADDRVDRPYDGHRIVGNANEMGIRGRADPAPT